MSTKSGAGPAGLTATFAFIGKHVLYAYCVVLLYSFGYTGTGVEVYGSQGSIDVYGMPSTTYKIDGKLASTYIQPIIAPGYYTTHTLFFRSPQLSAGGHELVIETTNGTTPNVFWLDYIIYSPSATTTSQVTSPPPTILTDQSAHFQLQSPSQSPSQPPSSRSQSTSSAQTSPGPLTADPSAPTQPHISGSTSPAQPGNTSLPPNSPVIIFTSSTTSSTATPSSSSDAIPQAAAASSSSRVPVGPIVAGVVGGVVLLLLIIFLVALFYQRKRRKAIEDMIIFPASDFRQTGSDPFMAPSVQGPSGE